MNLQGRDFLTLKDFSPEEIEGLVHLGLKMKKKESYSDKSLAGKKLAMIFEKASTRTRVSFEVGMMELGGDSIYLSSSDMQIGRGEPIKDTARVLSRYVDGILIRTFSQESVEELAKYASVPVINGLTDLYHPTQVIADLITILEHKGAARNQTLCYVGDGNNMAHSLMIGGLKMGMNIRIATPEKYAPDAAVCQYASELAKEYDNELIISNDPLKMAEGADIIYTDTWASMGQEAEKAQREIDFAGYQVNQALMDKASNQAIFLHCLPAYRGFEVSEEVLEGPQSLVFEEAENRLHAHKAILTSIL